MGLPYMPYIPAIELAKADAFADGAHRAMKQRRKVTDQPYIVHPRLVASVLRSAGCVQDVVVAGLLHDVIEDTGVTRQDLSDVFGDYVALLVDEVTNITVPSDGCRAVRAAIERRHLASASEEAQDIKLADICANLSEVRNLKPSFAAVYVAEKELLLRVLTKGREALRELAASHVQNAINYLKENS